MIIRKNFTPTVGESTFRQGRVAVWTVTMQQRIEEFLNRMFACRRGAVISLPAGESVRHCRSRLLARDADGKAIWVQGLLPVDIAAVGELLATGRPLAVTCKDGFHRLTFLATAAAIPPSRPADVPDDAIFITDIERMSLEQRRRDYRVKIGAVSVGVRCWKIADHVPLRDRAPASSEFHATIHDISVGGLGMTATGRLPTTPINLQAGERLRIELSLNDETNLFDGRVCYSRPAKAAGAITVGVAFKCLDRDVEGRQKFAWLTRKVGELRQSEVTAAKNNRAA